MKKIKLMSLLFAATFGVMISTVGNNVEAANSYNVKTETTVKTLSQVKQEANTDLLNWRNAGVIDINTYSSMRYMLNNQTSVTSHQFYFDQFKESYEAEYQAVTTLKNKKADALKEIDTIKKSGKLDNNGANIFKSLVNSSDTVDLIDFYMNQIR